MNGSVEETKEWTQVKDEKAGARAVGVPRAVNVPATIAPRVVGQVQKRQSGAQ